MVTVKEFKEWLNRFPDDTIVEVAIQGKPDSYQSYGSVSFESPKLGESEFENGWSFINYTDNQFVKYTDEWAKRDGKKISDYMWKVEKFPYHLFLQGKNYKENFLKGVG